MAYGIRKQEEILESDLLLVSNVSGTEHSCIWVCHGPSFLSDHFLSACVGSAISTSSSFLQIEFC